MTRRRPINVSYGRVVAKFAALTGIGQTKLAERLGLQDSRRLREILIGRLPDEKVRATIAAECHQYPELLVELDEALRTGEDSHRKEIFLWGRANHELTGNVAKEYYRDLKGVLDFPIITQNDWLPEQPIPLDDFDQKLSWYRDEPQAPALHLRALDNELYTQFISRAAPEVRLTNDFCYRLIGISGTGGDDIRFRFGPTRYFDFVDSCEALSYEVSDWCFRNRRVLRLRQPRRNKTDLPARQTPRDIFNFAKRNVSVGVGTFLLVTNLPSGDYFYLHERTGVEVLEDPGGWHVVPSGTFQPDSAEDVHHKRDFSVLRSTIREFAEELLGNEELQSVIRTHDDFFHDPRLSPYLIGLRDSSVRAYFLGMGISPLSTKAVFVTALVLDASRLPADAVRFVNNFEGKFLAVPLEELVNWSVDPRMHPSASACCQLAQRHVDFLKNNEHRHHLHYI